MDHAWAKFWKWIGRVEKQEAYKFLGRMRVYVCDCVCWEGKFGDRQDEWCWRVSNGCRSFTALGIDWGSVLLKLTREGRAPSTAHAQA